MVRTPTVLTRRTDGRTRGGFQPRRLSAFTVCEVDPSLAVRASNCVADDGNSLAASLWHKGGFKTRPYKLRDCEALPVRGLRTLVICDRPALSGEGLISARLPRLRRRPR